MIHGDTFAETTSFMDENTVWRAWAFRKSGVILVREGEERDLGPGVATCHSVFVEFSEEGHMHHTLFELTLEQRAVIGMTEAVYHDLNVGLKLDYEKK